MHVIVQNLQDACYDLVIVYIPWNCLHSYEHYEHYEHP